MPVSPNQPKNGNVSTPSVAPYTPPSSTPATSSSSSYNINYDDPYDLGSLGTAQIFTGVNPATPAGQDTPQKNVRGDKYNEGSPQTNATVSGSDLLKNFLAMYSSDRSEYDGLRTALANAGYYGSDKLTTVTSRTSGAWDSTAMKNAMADYVKYSQTTGAPTTFEDWLQGTNPDGSAGNSGGGGTGTPPNTQVQLTDPETLKQAAKSAAQATLGRNLTDDQLNAFVDQFHAQQTSSQQQTELAEEGNTNSVTTTPDASADALSFAQSSSPQEAKDHQTTGFMDAFYNMFLPSGSSMANTPTTAT